MNRPLAETDGWLLAATMTGSVPPALALTLTAVPVATSYR